MILFLFQLFYPDYDCKTRKEYRDKLTQDLYEIQKNKMPMWY